MKRTIYILLPLIVYYFAHDLVQFLLYMGINTWAGSAEEVGTKMQGLSPYMAAGVQVLSMLAGLGILLLGLDFCKKQNFFPEIEATIGLQEWLKAEKVEDAEKAKTAGRLGKRVEKHLYEYAFLCALVFMLLAAGLNTLFLQSPWITRFGTFLETSESQANTPFVMAMILFVIVSPLVEEFLFRGLLYERMKQCFTVPVSILISALFFGIYHGNAVQGVYGFLTGLYLAYVYEQGQKLCGKAKAGSALMIPMICHACANLIVYVGGLFDWYTKMPIWMAVLLLLAAGLLYGFTLTRRNLLH